MNVIKPRKRDIELPQIDLLTFLLDSSWTLSNDNTKLHIDGEHPDNYITKPECRDLVKRLAYVLRHNHGIGKTGTAKDAVCIISSGTPLLPVLFYAIVAAGGVMTGASTASKATEIARQIQDANVKLFLCSSEYKTLTVEVAKRCDISYENILVLDSSVPKAWTLLSIDNSDVLKRGNGRTLDWPRMTDRRQLQDTTICLLYSSGTTGLPKGVRLSHWAIMSSCISTMEPARRYKAANPEFEFSTIAHLPFANVAGISMYCTNPIYMGGSTYWMKAYDFDKFVEYNRRFKPAYIYTVPPIWLRIAKSDSVTDQFDQLQVGVTGSAPIGYATVQEVRKKLGHKTKRGKAVLTQTWGATEIAGVICALDWKDDPNTTFEDRWSVGEPVPNLRIRMVDDSDQNIDPSSGQPGEMLVGGDLVAQGYHNRPEETRSTFIEQDSSPPHGWYRTGDIGVYRNGLVYIVDRKKELIKYKGNQVAPAELEALLTSHNDIADAAVIGIWHKALETEVPKAYVVRKKPSITAEEVVEFVKQNVANYKQLRGGVVFIDIIPKSASGKILRKELRERENEAPKPKL